MNPAVVRSETVPLLAVPDVVIARRRVQHHAIEIGLDVIAQTKLLTATSELARNCVDYGGGGQARIEHLRSDRDGVRVVVLDEGAGIADIDLAMTEGWTSGTGLGLGLSGSRRLADEFVLDSAPGAGTSVTIVFWQHS